MADANQLANDRDDEDVDEPGYSDLCDSDYQPLENLLQDVELLGETLRKQFRTS